MCSSKFVEPPKAACRAIAFLKAAGVRMSFNAKPFCFIATTASADRVAMSSQTGWPDGANAECGTAMPIASATTCDVAAVPKNWQPPPGEAHALQPNSVASSSESMPCENRAPIVCTAPASSPCSGGNDTPPGTITLGRSPIPASAIIMAGSPLSQVATPRMPLRVGSERARRRKT